MTLLNRDVLGRRVQALGHLRVFSADYTVREWWQQACKRRGRGFYPRQGGWPFFRYWMLGPFELRVWTAESKRRLSA